MAGGKLLLGSSSSWLMFVGAHLPTVSISQGIPADGLLPHVLALPLPPSTEHRLCLLCLCCLENTTQCVKTTFINLPEIFESRSTFSNNLFFFILSYRICSEFYGVSWALSSAVLTW